MKGQAEIIGIAIVALFVVSLIVIIKPQPEPTMQQEEEEMAVMVMLLKTSVRCESASAQVSDLVRSCMDEGCSCRDSSINAFLQGLFEERSYDFEIVNNGVSVFREQTGDCSKKSIWLPSDESIEVRLGIC
jgi:hypothetical protein